MRRVNDREIKEVNEKENYNLIERSRKTRVAREMNYLIEKTRRDEIE